MQLLGIRYTYSSNEQKASCWATAFSATINIFLPEPAYSDSHQWHDYCFVLNLKGQKFRHLANCFKSDPSTGQSQMAKGTFYVLCNCSISSILNSLFPSKKLVYTGLPHPGDHPKSWTATPLSQHNVSNGHVDCGWWALLYSTFESSVWKVEEDCM